MADTLRTKVTDRIKIPVPRVLDGARHLHAVAVVGIDSDGELYIAGSEGTAESVLLFMRAVSSIIDIVEGKEQ